MELRKLPMPVLLDHEIEEAAQDQFGHAHFGRALRSLIEAQGHEPPFSIGLLGGWGTGKSTIKALYLEDLHGATEKNESGVRRNEQIYPITFNAWRYGGRDTDLKRALLRHVFRELGGDEQTLRDELSNQIQRSVQVARSWKEIGRDLFELCLWNLIPIIVLALLYFGLVILVLRAIGESARGEWTGIVGGAVSPAVLLAFAAKYFGDPRRFMIRRYAQSTRIELPRTSAEEFEDLLLEQLYHFKKSARGKRCERLVIFVDDLDRLSPDEMVSGLDAIRTFMELPPDKLPDGLGVVFVISCDEGRVAAALASRHALRTSSELPGAIHSLTDARRFLDRIFQFRLEIPPFPRQDMRQFVASLLDRRLPSVKDDLFVRGASCETLIDRMIHVGVDSPRKAIQILNAFAQSWWIACIREHNGAASDDPGGLRGGSVTDHPISLGALCALRVDFPDFFEQLQRDATLIERFSQVFLRGEELAKQPEHARHVLEEYALPAKNGDSSGSVHVQAEHRPLRQFLAGLQGHRWPDSIEPLLLLSQDRITRQYADGARRLYDALVSGDTAGVLAQFGLHLDNRDMTFENVQLLRDLLDASVRESPARRDHAAFVAASLGDRMPGAHASMVLSPLCARLGDSAALRWRVGLDGIDKTLRQAHTDHRRHLAQQLVTDLLRTEGPITFKKETGQSPSLREAVGMVRKAARIVLEVHSQDQLPSGVVKELVKWLQSRHVAIDKAEEILPYADFENWVAEHQTVLLPLLGDKYTELLLAELENDRLDGLVVDSALTRAEEVLVSLWSAGREDQRIFWEHLTRLVAVRLDRAVTLANRMANERLNEADGPVACKYVAALASRLRKERTDGEEWQLDWEEGAGFVVDFSSRVVEAFDDATAKEVADLAIDYVETEETAAQATNLVEILLSGAPAHGNRVVASVVPRLLDDAPQVIVTWLAQHVSDVAEEQQDKLREHLDAKVASQTPPEEVATRYRWFVQAMTSATRGVRAIEAHLVQAFTYLQQQHANTQHIERILPILAPLFTGEVSPQIAKQLQSLLTHVHDKPDQLSCVHQIMARYWPPSEKNLAGYNPNQIFRQALEFAKAHTGHKAARPILESITYMCEQGIVDADSSGPEVSELACALWMHHRDAALDSITRLDSAPDAARTAALMDQVNLADPQDFGRLAQAWAALAERQTEQTRIATAKEVLGRPRKPGPQDDIPDGGLSAWVDGIPEESRSEALQATLLDDALAEEAKRRVWAQVMRYANSQCRELLPKLLATVMGYDDSKKLCEDVLHSHDAINSTCATDERRRELARGLLEAIVRTKTIENRRQLAKWMHSIGGEGVLSELRNRNVDRDVLEVLAEVFPSNRNVKKRLKEVQE